MPTKVNGAGKQQEYDPNTGRFGEGTGEQQPHDKLKNFKKPEETVSQKGVDKTKGKSIISEHARKAISSVENKNRSLSYEVGTIIDKDGNILGVFDGAESEVYVKKEMLTPTTVLTHNHPKGTCFSTDDIRGFVDSGLYQIRATTPDGKTYVLTREKGYIPRIFTDEYDKVGKFKSPQMDEVQKRTQEYLSQGYDLWDARLKAQSDCKVDWLYENADKYSLKFDIEWEE